MIDIAWSVEEAKEGTRSKRPRICEPNFVLNDNEILS
jgi:hypothetical protein